jgi:hypothetical protein
VQFAYDVQIRAVNDAIPDVHSSCLTPDAIRRAGEHVRGADAKILLPMRQKNPNVKDPSVGSPDYRRPFAQPDSTEQTLRQSTTVVISVKKPHILITPEIERGFLDEPTGHPMYGKPASPTKASAKTALARLIQKTNSALLSKMSSLAPASVPCRKTGQEPFFP